MALGQFHALHGTSWKAGGPGHSCACNARRCACESIGKLALPRIRRPVGGFFPIPPPPSKSHDGQGRRGNGFRVDPRLEEERNLAGVDACWVSISAARLSESDYTPAYDAAIFGAVRLAMVRRFRPPRGMMRPGAFTWPRGTAHFPLVWPRAFSFSRCGGLLRSADPKAFCAPTVSYVRHPCGPKKQNAFNGDIEGDPSGTRYNERRDAVGRPIAAFANGCDTISGACIWYALDHRGSKLDVDLCLGSRRQCRGRCVLVGKSRTCFNDERVCGARP